MKQKIAVTGSQGQLGSELRSLSILFPQFDFIFLSKGDLAIDHADEVVHFFKTSYPQYLINCAAYTAVDKAESEKEAAFRINAEATGTLAAVCSEYHTKFFHISTDYVFDGRATIPYTEDAPINPQSIYGASKAAGEKQAIEFNPDSIIVRTSWVYSSYGKNFVKTMLKLLHEKEEINVVNDQLGSPTYAADLAGAILQIVASQNWRPSVYHYSNDGLISWYDFAVAIREMAGSTCRINPIPTIQYPTPAARPAYSVFDKTKIQQTFGLELKDWRESLAACLKKLDSLKA